MVQAGLMADFFQETSDRSVMSEDDIMSQLFPQSSSAPSHSEAMYAPILAHHSANLPRVSAGGSPEYYGSPQLTPSYGQQQYWTPMQQPSNQCQFTYPQYSLPSVTMAPIQLMPSSPHYLNSYPSISRSSSPSSNGTYHLAASGEYARTTYLRCVSPSSPDLRAYGYQNKNGTWTCAYPGCASKAVFTRGCDLRKHHKRHTKSYFCSYDSCPQSTGGGFSSKKDLARHMASHQPSIVCEWDGCDRVFSRVDNMRDHLKRIHMKTTRNDVRKRVNSC